MSEQKNVNTKQVKRHAIFVGVWPLVDAHDPALDEAGIPEGTAIFGLFDENYKKYAAPDSIPGMSIVSTIEKLTKDTYFVLNTSSGFEYILIMTNNPVDITVQMDEHENAVPRIENEVRAYLDQTLLDSALEFIDYLHAEQMTPQQWFGPGYCVKCSKDCKTNGNQGVDMTIFGKKHVNMCWQFPVRINDPDNETLVKVQKLIGFWKNIASSSDSIHVRD